MTGVAHGTAATHPPDTKQLIRLRGRLPAPQHHPVATPVTDIAEVDIRLNAIDRTIAVVYGPSGAGKTSTVSAALATVPGQWVYTCLAHASGMGDVIEALHVALHGAHGRGASYGRGRYIRSMRGDIEETLLTGHYGVVIDEIHYASVACMLTLSQIWESVNRENREGFPLFLVGADAHVAIQKNDELRTRIAHLVPVDTLNTEDIIAAVRAISPRCAATNDRKLAGFDRRHGHGNFRIWHHFIKSVERLPQLQGQPVSREEFESYLGKFPRLGS